VPVDLRGLKVLVVDDNQTAQEFGISGTPAIFAEIAGSLPARLQGSNVIGGEVEISGNTAYFSPPGN
jgi:protein-disulfide isomerase